MRRKRRSRRKKHLLLIFLLLSVNLFVGLLSIYMTKNVTKNRPDETNEIISNMELIESDYIKIVEADSLELEAEVAELAKDEVEKVVISLPSGIGKEQLKIYNDVFQKMCIIQFPMAGKNYDTTGIGNHSSMVQKIACFSKEAMTVIKIQLNRIADYEYCVNQGKLYLRFVNPKEKYPAVVVIDAGHGGKDVGAVNGDIYEKDIDLQVCKKLKEYVRGESFKAYFIREDDSFPSVEERVDFVNELMPDLFVSIHANAFGDPEVSGTTVLYNVRDTAEHGSKWLSQILLDNICASAQLRKRDLTIGNDIHIVRHSQVPVALVELGFMSSPSDFAVLTSADGQNKLAYGISLGIKQALQEMGKTNEHDQNKVEVNRWCCSFYKVVM